MSEGSHWVFKTLQPRSIIEHVATGHFRKRLCPGVVLGTQSGIELFEADASGHLESVSQQPIFGSIKALKSYPWSARQGPKEDPLQGCDLLMILTTDGHLSLLSFVDSLQRFAPFRDIDFSSPEFSVHNFGHLLAVSDQGEAVAVSALSGRIALLPRTSDSSPIAIGISHPPGFPKVLASEVVIYTGHDILGHAVLPRCHQAAHGVHNKHVVVHPHPVLPPEAVPLAAVDAQMHEDADAAALAADEAAPPAEADDQMNEEAMAADEHEEAMAADQAAPPAEADDQMNEEAMAADQAAPPDAVDAQMHEDADVAAMADEEAEEGGAADVHIHEEENAAAMAAEEAEDGGALDLEFGLAAGGLDDELPPELIFDSSDSDLGDILEDEDLNVLLDAEAEDALDPAHQGLGTVWSMAFIKHRAASSVEPARGCHTQLGCCNAGGGGAAGGSASPPCATLHLAVLMHRQGSCASELAMLQWTTCSHHVQCVQRLAIPHDGVIGIPTLITPIPSMPSGLVIFGQPSILVVNWGHVEALSTRHMSKAAAEQAAEQSNADSESDIPLVTFTSPPMHQPSTPHQVVAYQLQPRPDNTCRSHPLVEDDAGPSSAHSDSPSTVGTQDHEGSSHQQDQAECSHQHDQAECSHQHDQAECSHHQETRVDSFPSVRPPAQASTLADVQGWQSGSADRLAGFRAALADIQHWQSGSADRLAGFHAALADIQHWQSGTDDRLAGLLAALADMQHWQPGSADRLAGFQAALADMQHWQPGSADRLAGFQAALADMAGSCRAGAGGSAAGAAAGARHSEGLSGVELLKQYLKGKGEDGDWGKVSLYMEELQRPAWHLEARPLCALPTNPRSPTVPDAENPSASGLGAALSSGKHPEDSVVSSFCWLHPPSGAPGVGAPTASNRLQPPPTGVPAPTASNHLQPPPTGVPDLGAPTASNLLQLPPTASNRLHPSGVPGLGASTASNHLQPPSTALASAAPHTSQLSPNRPLSSALLYSTSSGNMYCLNVTPERLPSTNTYATAMLLGYPLPPPGKLAFTELKLSASGMTFAPAACLASIPSSRSLAVRVGEMGTGVSVLEADWLPTTHIPLPTAQCPQRSLPAQGTETHTMLSPGPTPSRPTHHAHLITPTPSRPPHHALPITRVLLEADSVPILRSLYLKQNLVQVAPILASVVEDLRGEGFPQMYSASAITDAQGDTSSRLQVLQTSCRVDTLCSSGLQQEPPWHSPGRDEGGEQPGSSAGKTLDGYGRSLEECSGDGEADDKVVDSSKPTTGLWPLAPRASDPHHSLLLMSFLQATRMMAIRGGSLVDVTDKLALISHEETIACGLVQEDLMLQVTPSQVQLCSLSSLAPTARHSHLGELAEAGAGAHASHDRDSTGSAACHDPAPAPGRRCDSTSSLDTLSKLCEGTNKLDVHDPQESSSSGLPAVYPTSSQDVFKARRMLEVSSSGDLCCDISSSSGLLRPSSPAAMAAEAGLWCPPTSSGSIIVGSVALGVAAVTFSLERGIDILAVSSTSHASKAKHSAVRQADARQAGAQHDQRSTGVPHPPNPTHPPTATNPPSTTHQPTTTTTHAVPGGRKRTRAGSSLSHIGKIPHPCEVSCLQVVEDDTTHKHRKGPWQWYYLLLGDHSPSITLLSFAITTSSGSSPPQGMACDPGQPQLAWSVLSRVAVGLPMHPSPHFQPQSDQMREVPQSVLFLSAEGAEAASRQLPQQPSSAPQQRPGLPPDDMQLDDVSKGADGEEASPPPLPPSPHRTTSPHPIASPHPPDPPQGQDSTTPCVLRWLVGYRQGNLTLYQWSGPPPCNSRPHPHPKPHPTAPTHPVVGWGSSDLSGRFSPPDSADAVRPQAVSPTEPSPLNSAENEACTPPNTFQHLPPPSSTFQHLPKHSSPTISSPVELSKGGGSELPAQQASAQRQSEIDLLWHVKLGSMPLTLSAMFQCESAAGEKKSSKALVTGSSVYCVDLSPVNNRMKWTVIGLQHVSSVASITLPPMPNQEGPQPSHDSQSQQDCAARSADKALLFASTSHPQKPASNASVGVEGRAVSSPGVTQDEHMVVGSHHDGSWRTVQDEYMVVGHHDGSWRIVAVARGPRIGSSSIIHPASIQFLPDEKNSMPHHLISCANKLLLLSSSSTSQDRAGAGSYTLKMLEHSNGMKLAQYAFNPNEAVTSVTSWSSADLPDFLSQPSLPHSQHTHRAQDQLAPACGSSQGAGADFDSAHLGDGDRLAMGGATESMPYTGQQSIEGRGSLHEAMEVNGASSSSEGIQGLACLASEGGLSKSSDPGKSKSSVSPSASSAYELPPRPAESAYVVVGSRLYGSDGAKGQISVLRFYRDRVPAPSPLPPRLTPTPAAATTSSPLLEPECGFVTSQWLSALAATSPCVLRPWRVRMVLRKRQPDPVHSVAAMDSKTLIVSVGHKLVVYTISPTTGWLVKLAWTATRHAAMHVVCQDRVEGAFYSGSRQGGREIIGVFFAADGYGSVGAYHVSRKLSLDGTHETRVEMVAADPLPRQVASMCILPGSSRTFQDTGISDLALVGSNGLFSVLGNEVFEKVKAASASSGTAFDTNFRASASFNINDICISMQVGHHLPSAYRLAAHSRGTPIDIQGACSATEGVVPIIYMGCVSGAVYTLAPVTDAVAAALDAVATSLMRLTPGVSALSHANQEKRHGRNHPPQTSHLQAAHSERHVIDGDLLHAFLDLPSDVQEEVLCAIPPSILRRALDSSEESNSASAKVQLVSPGEEMLGVDMEIGDEVEEVPSEGRVRLWKDSALMKCIVQVVQQATYSHLS